MPIHHALEFKQHPLEDAGMYTEIHIYIYTHLLAFMVGIMIFHEMMCPFQNNLSNEKRAPGCLGYIGNEILPSYIGLIISHYKDPS